MRVSVFILSTSIYRSQLLCFLETSYNKICHLASLKSWSQMIHLSTWLLVCAGLSTCMGVRSICTHFCALHAYDEKCATPMALPVHSTNNQFYLWKMQHSPTSVITSKPDDCMRHCEKEMFAWFKPKKSKHMGCQYDLSNLIVQIGRVWHVCEENVHSSTIVSECIENSLLQ
jgi:hypothetical protein